MALAQTRHARRRQMVGLLHRRRQMVRQLRHRRQKVAGHWSYPRQKLAALLQNLPMPPTAMAAQTP